MNEFPTNHPENVYPDIGGWISGPMLDSEPVPAGQVRRGDRIIYGGRLFEVTAEPVGAWYHEDGQLVSGVAIIAASGSAVWTLYRQPDDILHRVP